MEADELALFGKLGGNRDNEIWKFERLLRLMEYPNSPFSKWFVARKFHKLSLQLGFDISPKVFGAGLSIAHRGPIVVNPKSKVGENCRLHICVVIGADVGRKGPIQLAPRIGDNVFIGAGAKIIGDIEIADGIVIGANTVVNKSFAEQDITIAGCPARKISENGSDGCLIKATEILRRDSSHHRNCN
jgi:serine O-acetyltransferase